MRQSHSILVRQILPIGGLLLGGAIALTAPVSAKPAPPVIRASGFTPQVPLCYIETTNSGFQNLDTACLMGKDRGAGTIDMVTDRDKDGVPDALVPFFQEMDKFGDLASAATPQARQALMGKMQKSMNNFAERSPLSPALKADFKTMIGALSTIASITPSQPGSSASQRQLAQINAAATNLDTSMRRLQKDPFMKQVEQYSSRYQENKYKKMRAELSR
jgi:hypothetical protein